VVYWKAKGDLEFVKRYRASVTEFWKADKLISLAKEEVRYSFSGIDPKKMEQFATELDAATTNYPILREQISKGLNRATYLANNLNTTWHVTSYPPPAIAGSSPAIPINLFQAVLMNTSYGHTVTHEHILDALNELVGACEEEVDNQWKHLINPLYWIFGLLKFVIRLPFILVQLSGFDISKVEDLLISKLFKLAEIGFVFYLLYRLGMTNQQFRDLISKMLTK
jgi:hypothetical protein